MSQKHTLPDRNEKRTDADAALMRYLCLKLLWYVSVHKLKDAGGGSGA